MDRTTSGTAQPHTFSFPFGAREALRSIKIIHRSGMLIQRGTSTKLEYLTSIFGGPVFFFHARNGRADGEVTRVSESSMVPTARTTSARRLAVQHPATLAVQLPAQLAAYDASA